jgi:hypothetical protein
LNYLLNYLGRRTGGAYASQTITVNKEVSHACGMIRRIYHQHVAGKDTFPPAIAFNVNNCRAAWVGDEKSITSISPSSLSCATVGGTSVNFCPFAISRLPMA